MESSWDDEHRRACQFSSSQTTSAHTLQQGARDGRVVTLLRSNRRGELKFALEGTTTTTTGGKK